MNKVWHDKAWDEYFEWQKQVKKTLRRINDLLKDIDRNPFSGIGKPEPLKGNKQGYWSRRIDEANRKICVSWGRVMGDGSLDTLKIGGAT